MKSKKSFLSTLVFSFWFLTSFISIRDDKPDEEYLSLGKKYPQVCKVGERGGDGTLIGPRWIITAAHVADGMYARHGDKLKIFFQGDNEGVLVKSIYIHPEFKPMGNHDIALIELSKPITIVSPAGLYGKSDESGKRIVIVGHGDFKTGIGGEWLVDGKKRAATNLIEKTTEDHIIYHFDDPSSKRTTELEGTAGRGDSGGPAFITDEGNLYVAGISSAGLAGKNGPGTYGAVEYYTRVSTHLKWINDVLERKIINGNNSASRPQPSRLEGLGLILEQGNNRINIIGKVDPEVPKEFRDVLFNPQPSFIVSLNGKKYELLELFNKAFKAIKKGSRYEIEFSVRGKISKFETIR